jgi:hypothetical protein
MHMLVSIAPDPDDFGAVVVRNHRGEPCGVLPRRGNLCKEILAGAKVGHISWQMLDREPDGQLSRLRIRVVTVNEGEHFEMPPMAEPKQYPVGIVGEASYQPSIRRCSVGQRVQIVHEPDNPYDKKALAVVTEDGETLGYIARDCWLQDAIHEQGRGCEATIKGIRTAGAGKLGVVLDVALCGRGIPTRAFNRTPAPKPAAAPAPAAEPKGWLARLFGL